MTTLAIDTSNETLGVALAKDGILIGEIMTTLKQGQTARLMPAIHSLMEQTDTVVEDLKELVVARGPGSYTGVRVGVTTAKSMAWGLDLPIYPVSSLRALAFNGSSFDGYVMPFFNARRNAMFTALYRFEVGKIQEIYAEQYVSFADWIHTIKEQKRDEKILCLSPHLSVFEEQLRENLTDSVVLPKAAEQYLRPGHLLAAREQAELKEVHLVKPNYLRMTEAEANLLKEHDQRSE